MSTRRGFTLIELLVVVAILGLMAALVTRQIGTVRIRAKNASAKTGVVEAGKAIETYKDGSGNDLLLAAYNGRPSGAAQTAANGGVQYFTNFFQPNTAIFPYPDQMGYANALFNNGTAAYAGISSYKTVLKPIDSTPFYHYEYITVHDTDGSANQTFSGDYLFLTDLSTSDGSTDQIFWVKNNTVGSGVLGTAPVITK